MVQEILVGPERRRRWSDEQKIAIVVEAASGGASVSDVARRHGISRQQIYQWRSDIRRGRLIDQAGGPFLAVEFVAPTDDEASPPLVEPVSDTPVEIMLRKGRSLRVPASIPVVALSALIRAVEAA
jgi:transposase